MTDAITYGITRRVLGFSGFIEISSDEFEDIQAAKGRLLLGRGIEEKFDLLMENHAEIERTLLGMALENSLFPGRLMRLLNDARHLLNRRMANYLTTARLYLDQTKHDISTSYGRNCETSKRVQDVVSTEYEGCLGYRVMEALRNHAQHRGLPVHAISFPWVRDDRHEPPRFRYGVVPAVSTRELQDDPRFKPEVLKELERIADKRDNVDLMPFVRGYTEAIGRIHQHVRQLLSGDMTRADELLVQVRDKALSAFGEKLAGLSAVRRDEAGCHTEWEYITTRLTEQRKEFEVKNSHLESLSARYVSSEG